MNDAKDAVGLLLFIAAAIFAVLAYNGVLYTTGDVWYDACWKKKQAQVDFSKEPTAPDPETDILWKNCERSAEKAFYDKGMVFSGLPKDSSDQRGLALKRACPSNWSDVALGGFYMNAVDVVAQNGGPSILDRILPADMMLGRMFEKTWPNCARERMAQGYPKVVEISPNNFQWAEPCSVCGK
jgi:hypothetical protein